MQKVQDIDRLLVSIDTLQRQAHTAAHAASEGAHGRRRADHIANVGTALDAVVSAYCDVIESEAGNGIA